MSAYGFASFEPEDDYSPEPDRCHACDTVYDLTDSADCACRCDALDWLERAAQHLYTGRETTPSRDIEEPTREASRLLAVAWLQVSRGMAR